MRTINLLPPILTPTIQRCCGSISPLQRAPHHQLERVDQHPRDPLIANLPYSSLLHSFDRIVLVQSLSLIKQHWIVELQEPVEGKTAV